MKLKDSSILIKNYQKNLTILEFASIKRVVFDSLLTSQEIDFEDLPTSINEIRVDLKVKVIKENK
jgi:hypothetical protein